MYQLLVILIVATLLSGCESLQRERFLDASNELWGRAGAAFKDIGQPEPKPTPHNDFSSELDPLFEQPYIDPLTRYLNRHEGDERRYNVLAKVRQERRRRCSVIANQYAAKPISQEALNLYRVGYLFSCPKDVDAYTEQLEKFQSESSKKKVRTAETAKTSDPEADTSTTGFTTSRSSATADGEVTKLPPSQQLSDCYLLTTIRNFSGAAKACLQPAEAGDVQAQTNMALIAYSLRDYASAHHWALRAAPESGFASYLLGQMYMAGNGVEQNKKEANKWYTKAAEQGHSEAKAALEEHSDGAAEGEVVN